MARLAASALPVLAIGVVTLIAYYPSIDAGFVFDSRFLVLQDSRVHAATAEHLQQIFQQSYWWPYGDSSLYRPLTTLSFLGNYLLSGDSPKGYHAINDALHLANALLFYVACLRLMKNRNAAVAAALLWAVVPLSTEAVANIAGRADLISGIFVWLGFLSYLRFVETQRTRWLLALAMSAVCGLFAKESTVALVPIVAVHYWLRGPSHRSNTWRIAAAVGVPIVLLIVVRLMVLGSVLSAQVPFVDNPIAHASWLEGRFTALRVLGSYLQLFVWPANLLPDYSYPQIPLASGSLTDVAAWATLAGAAVVAWFVRANRIALLGFAIAFFSILPASNLLFASGTIMGERLMYLPSAGLCLAVVAIFATGALAHRQWIAVALAVIVVAGWSARTYARSQDWRSEVTLWQAAIRDGAKSAKTHRALAEALYEIDPQHTNLDTVLDLSRKTAALLADLPPDRRSFQEFRQLAGYSIDMANRRSGAGAAASYNEALAAADAAMAILTSQTALQDPRAAETRADLHRLKAVANLGVGNNTAAKDDARRAVELNAFHPIGYLLSANASLALNDPATAAEDLATGAMVLKSAEISNELTKLYQHVDATGCSVQYVSGVALVNPDCPAVRGTLCNAARRAIGALDRAGRPEESAALKARAANEFGCL